MDTGRSGAGDEEGHVSWGRELKLQGAGKSWVGVLPSSDLGLVGGLGKADAEALERERFRMRRRMEVLPSFSYWSQLLKQSRLCGLPNESHKVKGIPRLISPS